MKRLAGLTILLIAVGSAWYVAYQPFTAGTYQLTVTNNMQDTVDIIRVFGPGMVDDAVIKQLQPGQVVELELALESSGELRFEVIRGYNRVDAMFERDVSTIEHYQQWLLLNDNNRFVLSDYAPD